MQVKVTTNLRRSHRRSHETELSVVQVGPVAPFGNGQLSASVTHARGRVARFAAPRQHVEEPFRRACSHVDAVLGSPDEFARGERHRQAERTGERDLVVARHRTTPLVHVFGRQERHRTHNNHDRAVTVALAQPPSFVIIIANEEVVRENR